MGRANQIPNVEISALINMGYDYLALGQYDQAVAYLAPTLERVERDAFGSHRWRWKIRLLMGLAEHAALTGADAQALQYVDAGLSEAQATSSKKYVAKGHALRGQILAQLGETDAAGAALRRGFILAEPLQSPSLLSPIAYHLGQWCETNGRVSEAVSQYARAKAIIERMAASVEDEALRATFLQSDLAQTVDAGITRLDG